MHYPHYIYQKAREATMPVEFAIPFSDFHQAIEQLNANRGAHTETDVVNIVVSETAALFHALGTEYEAQVNGIHTGSVQIPLSVLNRVRETFSTHKKKDMPVRCERGMINIGAQTVRHPQIALKRAPKNFQLLPIDISLLDTLALSRIFPSRKIDDEGIRPRLNAAERTRRAAIAEAAKTLEVLEIGERELTFVVESHIRQAADRLRKSLVSN